MIEQRFEHNGKEFHLIPHDNESDCNGCAFEEDEDGCDAAGAICIFDKVIWGEKVGE